MAIVGLSVIIREWLLQNRILLLTFRKRRVLRRLMSRISIRYWEDHDHLCKTFTVKFYKILRLIRSETSWIKEKTSQATQTLPWVPCSNHLIKVIIIRISLLRYSIIWTAAVWVVTCNSSRCSRVSPKIARSKQTKLSMPSIWATRETSALPYPRRSSMNCARSMAIRSSSRSRCARCKTITIRRRLGNHIRWLCTFQTKG